VVTLVYVIASVVVALIGSLIGIILCLVGLFVTLPAAQFITVMIQSHLYGQVGLGAKSWETSIVPEEYIPQPPAAPSAYDAPGENAVEPAYKPEGNAS
jgi:hypothetical protein